MTSGESKTAPPAWSGRALEDWALELGVPQLELHRELTSTSDRLRTLGQAGAPPFTTVIAGAQTRGRGRSGRAWHSAADSGLWMSVLLPSKLERGATIMPLVVGVATARALERFAPDPVRLKWPNDLLVDSQKIAGILCEATGDPGVGIVVGIGVNLRPPQEGMPDDLEMGVVFLESLAGTVVSEPALAHALLDEIVRWTRAAPERLEGALRAEWDRRDCLRGHPVRLENGLLGVVRQVADDGALELLDDDGCAHTVRSGSVRLELPGASPALHHFTRNRVDPGGG